MSPARTANNAASFTRLAKIGTTHAGRAAGNNAEVNVGCGALALDVDPQNFEPVFELGQRHDHLTVETTGAKQCWVEDVGPVRGGHHDDALGCLEAIHFGKHLVQGLLAFIVTAAKAGATLAAD